MRSVGKKQRRLLDRVFAALKFTPSRILQGLLMLALLSMSHYFAISLPSHNKKLRDYEEVEKGIRDYKRAMAKDEYRDCLLAAEKSFNSDLELNGEKIPDKKDAYTLNRQSLERITKDQQWRRDECLKKLELALKLD